MRGLECGCGGEGRESYLTTGIEVSIMCQKKKKKNTPMGKVIQHAAAQTTSQSEESSHTYHGDVPVLEKNGVVRLEH